MATAQDWAFEVGDRVRSVGGGADDECGKVLAVAGDELSGGVIADGCVLVAWDQGIRTVIEVSALEYEPEPSAFEVAASQGLRVWRFTAADGRVLSDHHLIPSAKSAATTARILADREQVSVSYCELFADGSQGAVTTIDPEVV